MIALERDERGVAGFSKSGGGAGGDVEWAESIGSVNDQRGREGEREGWRDGWRE